MRVKNKSKVNMVLSMTPILVNLGLVKLPINATMEMLILMVLFLKIVKLKFVVDVPFI